MPRWQKNMAQCLRNGGGSRTTAIDSVSNYWAGGERGAWASRRGSSAQLLAQSRIPNYTRLQSPSIHPPSSPTSRDTAMAIK